MKSYINKYRLSLEQAGKSSYTIQAYVKDLEQVFITIRATKLKDITEDSLKKYVNTLKKANYDPKSISRKINSIKSFYRFLKENNLVKLDPSEILHHPKIKDTPPRCLTKEEYTKLKSTCVNDLRTYTMIELLLQTGIRIGELCRLKLSDICYKSKVKPYAIRIDKYESSSARVVPLNLSAAETLCKFMNSLDLKNKNVYIFITRSGKPIIIRNARTYISNAMKKAKIHNATVNDLRNTFIFHQLKNGENILRLSQIVGHKNLSSTIKYSKIKKGKYQPKTQVLLRSL